MFEGIDRKKVGELGGKAIDELEGLFNDTLKVTKSQSMTLAKSAEKTLEIGRDAVNQAISGKLDGEGAAFVWNESAKQTVQLAHAEGNLLAANSLKFLQAAGSVGIKFVLSLLGIK